LGHGLLEAVEAAAKAIASEEAFLPAKFWMACDNDNEHDANAVSVHAVVGQHAYHVGFLPKEEAPLLRQSMAALDVPEGVVEVLGCITHGKNASHPNAHLYLPLDFAKLVASGYTANKANRANWLLDPSPVLPRPWQGRDAQGFTDDELRKIYCFYARKQCWNSLPHKCEAAAQGFRGCRGSVPLPMDSFVLEPEPVLTPNPKTPRREFMADAKVFAKKLIRDHLEQTMSPDEVDAQLKGTSFAGPGGGPDGDTATIAWMRMRPMKRLAHITLTCTGPNPEDFHLDELKFRQA
jgi:hypothetical protein